jgi:hypothetical protein
MKVVFPLPILPSTKIVNGRLLFTDISPAITLLLNQRTVDLFKKDTA